MNLSDLQNNDQHFSSYKDGFSPDVEAGLSRLHGRIRSEVSPQAKARSLSRRGILSVAATVLLLLSAGFMIFTGDGSTILENTTDAPMAITLPDGTAVLLQQGSELSYGTDYNEVDRMVGLAGQAYFEVVKNADRPFLVNSSETELRVTGTAFNLRVNDEELEVEVSEGSIELHRAGEVVSVKAKQCGLAVRGKASIVMTAEDLNRHAWRTGLFRFDSVSFTDVIKMISNNYSYSIDFPKGCDFLVSGTFFSEDPVSVLQTIAVHGQGELEVVDEVLGKFSLSGVCE
jgi:transmembrane sensor